MILEPSQTYTAEQKLRLIKNIDPTLARKVLAEKSLKAFIEQSWHIVESRKPLLWNWHLDCICQHLECVTNTYICKSGLAGRTINGFYYDGDLDLPSINYLWFNLPPRHTKLIADSQPVLTPVGWRKHGDLKTGDYVFGSDGHPTKIIATTPKDIADMEVVFGNGEIIKCNGDHLWAVYDRNAQKYKTLSTNNMMNTKYISYEGDKKRARYQLPITQPCIFEEKELPLDPYFLGLWLGDGSNSKPAISHDKNKIVPILDKLKNIGIIETKRYDNAVGFGKNGHSVRVEFRNQGIIEKIREVGLYKNKHIPNIYKQSSIEQRLQLMAGYIDTDGSCDKNGRIRIGTASKQLSLDVYDVALSLGWRPYIMESDRETCKDGKYYHIGFNPTHDIPIATKYKKPKRKAIERRVGILEIRKAEHPETGNCIQIENQDGLYCVGKKNVLTHNSLIVGVFWPCWEWGPRNLPELGYIFSSYAQGLSTRDSIKRRRLMQSKYYQSNWGERWFFTSDQNSKTRFDNDRTGHMIATSVEGMGTGEGGDRVICLPYDELIRTDKGNIPIGHIVENKLDVKILSVNHNKKITESYEYKTIEAYESNPGKSLIEFEIDDDNPYKLKCTYDHPIYNPINMNQYGWDKDPQYQKACDFKVGDKLFIDWSVSLQGLFEYNEDRKHHISYQMMRLPITKMTELPSPNKVYNIRVADNHNYFANGILVHNCDDPNSVLQIESQVKAQKVLDWWDDTMGNRINDDDTGAYIGVMQRTGVNDLTGHMLDKVKAGEVKNFTHICLPARFEIDHPVKTVTPLNFKDPRTKDGQALDELRWPLRKLIMREGRMSSWAIAGQHQQRPAPKGGSIVPVNNIRIVDDYNPNFIKTLCRYWDKAINTEGSGSSTASVLMATMKDPCPYDYIILDAIKVKLGAGDRENMIRNNAILDGTDVHVGVEQEPGSGGKESALNSIKKTLAGFKSFADRPTGAKEVRLEPFAAQVEHHNVAVLNRDWTKQYLNDLELSTFNHVLDYADATSGAFNYLAGVTSERKAKIRVRAA